jgi:hypothetical protein
MKAGITNYSSWNKVHCLKYKEICALYRGRKGERRAKGERKKERQGESKFDWQY